MEPYFGKLHTIEINSKLYKRTKGSYHGNKINFILGDSSIVLNNLLPTITEKCIFFLDGHWSCGNTGRGDKDCPLIEEIEHINNLFQYDGIIIIDDFRLFGLPKEIEIVDWSEINKDKILNILNSRINKVYHLPSNLNENDRFIIHINAKTN